VRTRQTASGLKRAAHALPLAGVDREHYEVGEEVARGGLGRIIQARDRRLNRLVAVKLLRVRDARAESRFLREALITARLQHPAIVPIYEAGVWPDGEPFYAMKLLAGKSLAELIEQTPKLEQRLALLPNVISVVDAIAYAHENRVIHRDLKPHNIMVAAFGETVVIDWGLAKDLDADLSDSGEGLTPSSLAPSTPSVYSGDTVAGSVLGTPAYMPPEQAQGQKADERADVYALGAVLYHLLAGRMPFSGLSPQETKQRLRMGAPPELGSVAPGAPVDLIAIVHKAMAPDRAHRYPSARELAADLRRFETGQLVSVRAYGWWEVLWRALRKNLAVVAVAAIALLSVLAVAGVSLRRIIQERNVAVAARSAADVARVQADRRGDEMVRVQAATALERDPTAALAWLKQHPSSEQLPLLRTIASDAQARGAAKHVFRKHEGRVTGLSFGADADHLASIGADGFMVAYDLKRSVSRPLLSPPGLLWALARAPDGKTLAVADMGKTVRLIGDAPERRLDIAGGRVLSLEYSPEGRFLAAGTVEGKVWLWNLDTGDRRDLPGHNSEVRDLAFSRDGALLASTGFDGKVRLITLASGEAKTLSVPRDEVFSADFGADGLLAIGGEEGVARLWDRQGALVAELRGHKGPIVQVEFSPDGTLLATGSRDHTLRLWRAPFKDSRVLEGHSGEVLRLAFSPDGRTLASASTDRTVRLWDLGSSDVRVLEGHEAALYTVTFSPDGSALASSGQDGSVRVWSVGSAGGHAALGFKKVALSPLGTGKAGLATDGTLIELDAQAAAHVVPGSDWRWFGFADEERLVGLDGNRDVVLWQNGVARTLGRLTVDIGYAALASGQLAVAAWDGTVHVWNLADGSEHVWRGHKQYTLNLLASPDGKLLASAGDEGDVKLWNVETGEARTLGGLAAPVHHIRFSPDGKLLASGDLNGVVRVWDVARGVTALEYKDHGFVRAVAFSRDGALLATGGDDKKVRVRKVATGETLAVLDGPEQTVLDLAFSNDGALVAAASADQTVRVFEWKSGAARVLRAHRAQVSRVLFSADGETLSSADEDGRVRTWHRWDFEPLPADRAGLEKWIDGVTSARIDADHRPATPW
jgi:WD40 repeat protein/tRNA A-37 threonylcarbamoyl transferase component Bud32